MSTIKKTSVYFTLLVMLFLASCTSFKKAVVAVQAFQLQVQKGNVQVNPKGEEVNAQATTIITLYVHSKTDKLQIDSAWLNSKPHVFNVQKIEQPFEVGYNSKNEIINVTPMIDGHLFQVSIVPLAKADDEAVGEVRLRCRYRNKIFYKSISTIELVRPFDAQ